MEKITNFKLSLTNLFVLIYEQAEIRTRNGTQQTLPLLDEYEFVNIKFLLARLAFEDITKDEQLYLINVLIDYSITH